MTQQNQEHADFIKCIAHGSADQKGKSRCGKRLAKKWAFQDIDHVVACVEQGARQVPCAKCLDVIRLILWPQVKPDQP